MLRPISYISSELLYTVLIMDEKISAMRIDDGLWKKILRIICAHLIF